MECDVHYPDGDARRILITGGLGYAGSWLVRHCARAGHEVFVLSRGPAAAKDSLPDLGVPYTFISADIAGETPQSLAAKLPGGIDACIHAAGAVNSASPDQARTGLMVNGLGVRNMLEALCLRAGTGHTAAPSPSPADATLPPPASSPPPRFTPGLPLFLFCSTFHVYGAASGHVTESSPTAPVNDYALTHLFGEEYCRMFARTRGMPCIILRPSNGYGAPLYSPFKQWNLLISDLCRSAYAAGHIVLRADPEQTRDFVWLEDVARAAESLIDSFCCSGLFGGKACIAYASVRDLFRRRDSVPVFNLSSGKALSLGEVARLAARTAAGFLQKEITLEFAAAGHEAVERFSPSGAKAASGAAQGGQGAPGPGQVGASAPKAAQARGIPGDIPENRHEKTNALETSAPLLYVDNTAIRSAFPGFAFHMRLEEEMTSTLEFLRQHEQS